VLQKGRIVEEGTFDFLQKNGVIFKDLWEYQQTKIADLEDFKKG
jgi:ABC-type multidrug transport system fused ATPase/permease subunit